MQHIESMFIESLTACTHSSDGSIWGWLPQKYFEMYSVGYYVICYIIMRKRTELLSLVDC